MTPQAPGTSKRLTALFLFIVLPIILTAWSVFNIVQLSDLVSLLATTRDQLARFDRHSGAIGARAGNPRPDFTVLFISARSASLAEAELQRRLVTLIEGNSGQLIEAGSADVSGGAADDHVIAIQATLKIQNDSLLRLMHAIETGVPLLWIDDLTIRRPSSSGSGLAGLGSGEDTLTGDPELRVDLRVRGRWRTEP